MFFGTGIKKGLPSSGFLPIHSLRDAEVAQLVEQGTENPRVGSSILSLGTTEINGLGVNPNPFFVLLSTSVYL